MRRFPQSDAGLGTVADNGGETALKWIAIATSLVFLCAGCSAQSLVTAPQGAYGAASSQRAGSVRTKRGSPTNPIQHVVVIVQENRSVDNLFNGFPGANTVTQGRNSKGQYVALEPQNLDSQWSVDHSWKSFNREYDNGKLDGFDLVRSHDSNGKSNHDKTFAYAYVPKNQVKPYWDMASIYGLSDETFQSNAGPSFPAHLYLIAGQSAHVSANANGSPWGCDAPAGTTAAYVDPLTGHEVHPGIFPCFDQTQIPVTLADELNAAGLTWTYYSEPIGQSGFGQNWNVYDSISWVRYGSQWSTNVISPETQILGDVAKGKLATITYVTPSAANSDHDGVDTRGGPNWVASVVNAVGNSKYWKSTAIFVIWDDWGGWYDHVAPTEYDYEGNGFRVPLIAISPYTPQGTLSHTQHESDSILKFIENRFNLAPMGEGDTRASDLTDLFNFSMQPRSFQSIQTNIRQIDVARAAELRGLPPDDDR